MDLQRVSHSMLMSKITFRMIYRLTAWMMTVTTITVAAITS